jgi:hypothetical protein
MRREIIGVVSGGSRSSPRPSPRPRARPSWARTAVFAALSLSLPPNTPIPLEDPLPRGTAHLDGPIAPTWTRRHALLTASRVRLHATGARTHSNWILFQVPFDTTQRGRIRVRSWVPSSIPNSDVGALMLGSVCLPFPSSGGVDRWAYWSVGGIYTSDPLRWHPFPPTDDPTVIAINVPTRVANYVACGMDDGKLVDPSQWTLDVTWDER